MSVWVKVEVGRLELGYVGVRVPGRAQETGGKGK